MLGHRLSPPSSALQLGFEATKHNPSLLFCHGFQTALFCFRKIPGLERTFFPPFWGGIAAMSLLRVIYTMAGQDLVPSNCLHKCSIFYRFSLSRKEHGANLAVQDLQHLAKIAFDPSPSVSSSVPFAICGLHCCGGLASSTLSTFVHIEAARALCLVGCCYNLLVPDDREVFISKLLRRASVFIKMKLRRIRSCETAGW